ncbi:hypothetical protein GCM10010149_89200 [Nonomuraea roseoviolacea subsp. roseoviolacea]|uniref:hypothetical protein n=1 Tax=Nonomuraea roseoviolacea TaxID=103837 RepID=UPI0031DEDC1E
MTALYPGELRVWSTKFDYTTIVFADHFNTAQDELVALLRVVGLTPQIARNDPGSTPFSLQPIVDWIGNAPVEDLDRIIKLLEDDGDEPHNYDTNKLLDRFRDLWPDWLAVTQ